MTACSSVISQIDRATPMGSRPCQRTNPEPVTGSRGEQRTMRSEKTACLMILGLLVALNGCGSPSTPQTPGATGPSASSITVSPVSAPTGSGDLPLTITGSNFDGEGVIQSQVVWSANGNDTLLTRTVDSSSQISAVVPAVLLS